MRLTTLAAREFGRLHGIFALLNLSLVRFQATLLSTMNSSRQIIGSDLTALLDGSVTTTLDE
jgi:hypothetical protein